MADKPNCLAMYSEPPMDVSKHPASGMIANKGKDVMLNVEYPICAQDRCHIHESQQNKSKSRVVHVIV